MAEIPSTFHSAESDKTFTHCLTCEKSLEEISEPYTISKVFKNSECVLEYSMCHSCRIEMSQNFSAKSRQNIDTFFNQYVNLSERSEAMKSSQNYQDWIQTCLTCGAPMSEITDYSLACMAFDNQLIFDPFPMVICSACEQQIQEQLSKETRDQWDKFISANFEGPPANALQPTGGVPVLA